MPRNSACTINLEALHKISLGDSQILNNLICTFIAQTEESLQEIEEGLSTSNVELLRKSLHKVLPSTSYFCTSFYQVLLDMQSCVHAGSLVDAKSVFAEVMECFEEIKDKLASVLNDTKASL